MIIEVKQMKKLTSILISRLFFVFFFGLLLFIVASGNKRYTNIVSNINTAKSLEAVHIVSKYAFKEEIKPMYASNMSEVKLYGPSGPVVFYGEMTGYGANCAGCSGTVSCPPRPNINDSVMYDDSVYGSVHILAADSTIPCGSIIKISNVSFSTDSVYGIVLDRGGLIKGSVIDFLVEHESYAASYIGRQKNVVFEIIRWGW